MRAAQALSPVRKALLVVGALLVFIGFNHAVMTKTQTLANGAIVKLKLAPQDPRGLLTGDYMALRYEIANALSGTGTGRSELFAEDGYVLVQVNAQGVAEFVGQSASFPTPGPGQVVLQFRRRDQEVKFATNAFYFQEGQAHTFEAARYGEFRVSPKGEMLLTHLLDEKGVRIEPK